MMLKKFCENNIKVILSLLIGMLIAGTGVYAATTIVSSSVAYDNSTSGGSSTNVKGALDELYNKAESHCPDAYNCWTDKPCSVIKGTGSAVGDMVKCGTEAFYVISNSGTNITLLAQYVIKNSLQTPIFDSTNVISSYSSTTYNLNSYMQYMNNTFGTNITSARHINTLELMNLGCDITNNSCAKAPSWVTDTYYWTSSPVDSTQSSYYHVSLKEVKTQSVHAYTAIRPVIYLPLSDVAVRIDQ